MYWKVYQKELVQNHRRYRNCNNTYGIIHNNSRYSDTTAWLWSNRGRDIYFNNPRFCIHSKTKLWRFKENVGGITMARYVEVVNSAEIKKEDESNGWCKRNFNGYSCFDLWHYVLHCRKNKSAWKVCFEIKFEFSLRRVDNVE